MQETITNPHEADLRLRRAELLTRLGRIEHDLDAPVNPDFEERAVEREGDEVLEDLGLAGQREMRAIDAALARIAMGTYGICTECGEPISSERLSAVPTAVKCRDCA